MDRYLLSFITAALSSLWWPVLPPVFCLIPLIVVTLLSLYYHQWLIAGCLSGVLWMASVGHSVSLWQLPDDAFSQPLSVTGKITTVAVPGEVNKFEIKLHCIEKRCFKVFTPTLKLSWYRPSFTVQQGQLVRLLVKLKRPYGLANQFGFNYQKWLFARQINATGYVKRSEKNRIVNNNVSLRQQLINKIDRLPDPGKRWLMAMSLGFRDMFTDQDWQLLQATGTSHLFAISGLHLGMVALNGYTLAAGILVFFLPYLFDINRLHLKRCALICALFTSAGFCILSGVALPTLRALILQMMVTALVLFNLNWSVRRILLCTVFVILILFPLSPWHMSFWLSYGAIVCLCFIAWRYSDFASRSIRRRCWGIIRLQGLLSVLMMPLVVHQFGGVSLVAPLVNIVAVPVVTFILLPLSLLSAFFIALQSDIAAFFTELTLNAFLISEGVLSWIADNSPSWLSSVGLTLAQSACLAVACLLVLLPKMLWPRWLSLVFLLPVISQFAISMSDAGTRASGNVAWRMHVFDVGQGLALAIERHRHIMLIDTGARFPSGFSMSKAVLLPWLKAQGIAYIPRLLLSHDDNDHAGGVSDLSQVYPIAKTIRSGQGCQSGRTEEWQGLQLSYLWPRNVSGDIGNHQSCVLKISDGVHSILLPGDIERPAEAQLLRQHAGKLQASVLIAPHHGSNTSSTSAFLKAVAPDIAVFSQGYGNRWGFPAEDVLFRYKKEGIRTLRTSLNGQITFVFSHHRPIRIIRQRQDRIRRWYLPARHD